MFVPFFSALSSPTQPLLPTCSYPQPTPSRSSTSSPLSLEDPLRQHHTEDTLPVKAHSSPPCPRSNARTRNQFKPRAANKGTSSYQLRQFAEATLGSGSLRKAVKLPDGEDLNEWLAVNGP